MIGLEQYDGLPVLIHEAGYHPGLLADDGRRISTLIVVVRGAAEVSVFGQCGRTPAGLPMSLPVGAVPTLEAARSLYPAAAKAIAEGPSAYSRYQSLLVHLSPSNGPLGRTAYEALATEHGFAAHLDADLVEWGDYTFPAYSLEALPRLWINQRRAQGVRQERGHDGMDTAAREAEILAFLRTRPVSAQRTGFVPLGSPSEFVRGGCFFAVVERGGRRPITSQDVNAHGDHLTGCEGMIGESVTWQVRQ